MKPWKRWKRRKITRDGFIFLFGVAGITYETLVSHADRPSLLFLFGACMGLPAFLHTDSKAGITPEVPKLEDPDLLSPEPSPPTKPTPVKRPAKKRAPVKRAPAKKKAPPRTPKGAEE